jgi:hypothetical protein
MYNPNSERKSQRRKERLTRRNALEYVSVLTVKKSKGRERGENESRKSKEQVTE